MFTQKINFDFDHREHETIYLGNVHKRRLQQKNLRLQTEKTFPYQFKIILKFSE